VLAVAALTAAAASVRFTAPLRLELGGGHTGDVVDGVSERAHRIDVDRENAPERKLPFYYRELDPHARVRLTFTTSSATLELTVRASAPDGALLVVSTPQGAPERVYLRPGPWRRDATSQGVRPGERVELLFAHDRLPGFGRGATTLFMDYLEVRDPAGLRATAGARALVALVPLALGAVLWIAGAGAGGVAVAAIIGGASAVYLFHAAPLPFLAGVPRLLPFALALGLLSAWLLRKVERRTRAAVVALTVAGALAHGAIAFFPNHNPPDRDIHVVRTLDIASVPWTYGDWLRYGSHLPTASQYAEKATLLFGEQALIPYSPLPAVVYYALHSLGLDLDWAITVCNTTAAMAVVPWMWLVVSRLWCAGAAWVAALLYTLDLAVWHHVGRVHAPAALAGAMGTAALLYLAANAGTLDRARRMAFAGAAVGVAALGYTSLAVLFFLFGLVLFVLLALDARALAPAARRGLALALVAGGLLAGILYYFHYVPGVLGGAGAVEAEPDLFGARTFFIFRNEAKQSLRVWRLGFDWWVLAGLVAAPFALRRAKPEARPVLVAWLGAWALLMLLKDPLFLPRLLRWAKEDQFLSPLLCMLIGAAAFALPRPWMRVAASALAVAGAACIEWYDYLLHANTLLL
jgi:hypothetical protein